MEKESKLAGLYIKSKTEKTFLSWVQSVCLKDKYFYMWLLDTTQVGLHGVNMTEEDELKAEKIIDNARLFVS